MPACDSSSSSRCVAAPLLESVPDATTPPAASMRRRLSCKIGVCVCQYNRQPRRNSGALFFTMKRVRGHSLSRVLATAWDRGEVSYVLAGSLPPAAAETAARSLK